MQCMMLKEIYQFIPEQGECSQAAYNCRPCAFPHQLLKKIHTLYFSSSKGIIVPVFREGLTRKKKKKCEISHLGGGSGQNWVIFTLFLFFFFYVLNHANLQRKSF